MIASRMQDISPFIVMEVLEKAEQLEKEGVNIIHLEVGEPDFNVPASVLTATHQALHEGRTHYTHSLGDPELRMEICRYYHKEYGVNVNPGQILVTSGSSPAILLVLSVLCNPDDEVILSDPCYACYPNFLKIVGAKMVKIPVFEDDGFQYRAKNIAKHISSKTKAIMINSPMNPTGNLLQPETLELIAKFSPHIISDEIYHGLVYGDKAHSILEYTDKAFVLNGFSKLYAMTGLRLGYVIAPPEFVRTMQKLQQNLFICANSLAQRAAIAALRESKNEVTAMRETYNKRRLYMLKRLSAMGLKPAIEPTGAFYVFINVKHFSSDSYRLAFDILEKAHVGVTPGIDFGENGEGYIRLSYANSLENIAEGLDRLEKYFAKYKSL